MDRAKALTGTRETTTLVRQSLETLIRDESGKGLIAPGATMPDADAAPRQRSDAQR
ncbi:type II toxin-antitoxin system VapB family antitoxin [Rhizobium sp. CFBP 8762]|uniref:type II toxin-antitoxin system VapB family antitoxin n=1 Tax=Rhizobium sp. CFBP 8762 TaxID=2775279 RepID=UPI00177F8139|nr:type II toxin-antitoxin system VapB family antitoxin [Rhizobium sp. CFBP 8762]MBD8556180.1 type II toxin-antitoxin system VapB family antitoxin [Rhizobium sp. CFBP 8762]